MASPVARALRKNPTEAERRLWSRLRRCQLDGFRFRRQVPLGPYVADFACLSARLVVEVDGGQHDWQSVADAPRTAWLEGAGFRVVRFWNNEVLGNTDGVVERIREFLKGPPLRPSPARGEGEESSTSGMPSHAASGTQLRTKAGRLPPPSRGRVGVGAAHA